MKLLTKNSILSLMLLFIVMGLGAVLIYLGISREVKTEIDEELLNRKLEIVQSIKKNPSENLFPKLHTDFTVKKINQSEYIPQKEYFEDIEIYELIEKEEEPHRQFVTKFKSEGKFYQLRIQASLLDLEDMAEIIVINTGWIYLALICSGFLLNRFFQKRLWDPFYSTLSTLKKLRVDTNDELQFSKTTTLEFEELSKVVSDLAETNRKRYQQQKQFVENASHEIQTPLAIALNQVEQLMQNPALNQDDADALLVLNNQLERLSSLNKSLLLITKINNQQFAENKSVDLVETVHSVLEEFAFVAEEKRLSIKKSIHSNPIILANPFLMEILVRNLIKNAHIHNINGGFIEIDLKENELEIRNSCVFEGQEQLLFQRFVKFSSNNNSLGLGLSIIKSISDLYNFIPSISASRDEFSFRLRF